MRIIPIIVSKLISRLIFIIGLLILVTTVKAQQKEISGIVIDSITKNTISDVNIIIKGTNKGTFTDNKGQYHIQFKEIPFTVVFSHIGYQNYKLTIKENNTTINVRLQRKLSPLKIVNISSHKAINLVKDKKLYVIDYEVKNDSVLLLCYNKRHLHEAQIVLLNSKSEIIIRKEINKINSFEEDYNSQNYLIGNKTARVIAINKKGIKLNNEISIEEFKRIQNTVIAYNSPFYYLRQNVANNQIVRIYKYNEKNDKLNLIKTIVDKAGMERLSDKARLQSGVNYSEADARFEEMCFYAPKYLPIVYLNKVLYFFNFNEDKIELIDTNGVIEKEIAIKFHHEKHWGKKIIVDKKRGNVYTIFIKNGFYKISKIDLATGTLSNRISIPHFVYIEKLKINNGKIYFLYKGNIDNKYKELYTLNI